MRFTARVFALTALALFLALLLAPSVAALEETAREAELEETVLEPTLQLPRFGLQSLGLLVKLTLHLKLIDLAR